MAIMSTTSKNTVKYIFRKEKKRISLKTHSFELSQRVNRKICSVTVDNWKRQKEFLKKINIGRRI